MLVDQRVTQENANLLQMSKLEDDEDDDDDDDDAGGGGGGGGGGGDGSN